MSKITWFFSMCGNYSVVSTPRVMLQIISKRKKNKLKAKTHCFRITFLEIKAFTFPIFEFSDFFMFFMFFDVPARFWQAPSHPKSCFLMCWSSGNLPRMILNLSWKLYFFMKIFQKVIIKCQVDFFCAPKQNQSKSRFEGRFWKLCWFSLNVFDIIKF